MDIFWFKLNANLDKDDRIFYVENQKNGDTAIWCYIKLLCVASRSNRGGAVYLAEGVPHTAKTLADQWHRHLSSTQKALRLLKKAKLIDIENGIIYISDWDKVQNVDKLEKLREQNRERQRKYREKHKPKITLPRHYDNDVEKEIEIEKEKEKEIELEDDDIYESVKDQFNHLATAIPKIIILSEKQKKAVGVILDKFGEELLNECFRIVGDSEFLQGKNAKNWVLTFDWLMNPDNFSKVLNGNYSAMYSSSNPSDTSNTFDDSGMYHSFDSDEFIEAALSRGFDDV